jgi:hypothetical protein
MRDPIAYTYEADHHCPACTFERFGRDEHGFPPEDAKDGEGNPIGVVAPWDEWQNIGEEGFQTLACSDCGSVLDTYHDQLCEGCEHNCPWKHNPLGAPYCQVCADHYEAREGEDE